MEEIQVDEYQAHFVDECVGLDTSDVVGSNFVSATQPGSTDVSAVDNEIIGVYIRTEWPMDKIKELLQKILIERYAAQPDLSGYEVWLQNGQVSYIEGERVVQINAQILHDLKRIKVVDVKKCAEDVINAVLSDETTKADEVEQSAYEQCHILGWPFLNNRTEILPQCSRSGGYINGQIELW